MNNLSGKSENSVKIIKADLFTHTHTLYSNIFFYSIGDKYYFIGHEIPGANVWIQKHFSE